MGADVASSCAFNILPSSNSLMSYSVFILSLLCPMSFVCCPFVFLCHSLFIPVSFFFLGPVLCLLSGPGLARM